MGRQTWEHSIDRESRALEVYLQIAKECLRTFSNTVNTSHPMMTWVVPMGVGSVYGWSPMRGNRALSVWPQSATLLYICTTSLASLQHNPLMQHLVDPRIGAPINNPLAQYVLLFQQSHHPPQLLYLWFGQCFGEQVCGHVLRLQVDWLYALAINLIA